LIRFGGWVWGLAHGDLGTSIFTNLPVTHLIAATHRAHTFPYALHAARGSAGRGAARRHCGGESRHLDRSHGDGVFSARFLGAGIVLAYILILVFSIELYWLPVQGYRNIHENFWDWLRHLILPSIALGTVYIALLARMTRASMLDVLAQDYIRTAQAKVSRLRRC